MKCVDGNISSCKLNYLNINSQYLLVQHCGWRAIIGLPSLPDAHLKGKRKKKNQKAIYNWKEKWKKFNTEQQISTGFWKDS